MRLLLPWLFLISSSVYAGSCEREATAYLAQLGWKDAESRPEIRPEDEGSVTACPLAMGVWLERHIFSDGAVEAWRVSEAGVVAARFAPAQRCQTRARSGANPHPPRFPGVKGGFTDRELASLLRKKRNGLIYAWSPKMPLSVTGIAEIEKAARALRLPLTLVVDPAGKPGKEPVSVPLRSYDLWRRGAFLHFPSLFLYVDGRISGEPILGNRGTAGFLRLLRSRLTAGPRLPSLWRGTGGVVEVPSGAQPLPAHVRKVTEIPSTFGYYDKPVWGTRWMSAHVDWSTSYLFNLDSHALVDLHYANDTYATPPDSLYTTFWAGSPDPEVGYLGFMETSEFLKIVGDPTYNPPPLFVDATLPADYQAVGLLRAGGDFSTYRVITGGYENFLSYRDYAIAPRRGVNPPAVKPVAPAGVLCKKVLGDPQFGTPVLSKDGSELSVTDRNGLTTIYAIDSADPESCRAEIMFALPTSKVAFSFDGRAIAFHRGDGLYVYHRDVNKIYELTGLGEAVGAGTPWFPDFREDGSLVLPYHRLDGSMAFVELDYRLP